MKTSNLSLSLSLTHPPLSSGYDAVPYELLQMSQSTDSDSQQATPSGLDSPLQKEPPSPAMPLQLGRLTSELYKLHSSSTHNLSRVASCDLPREIRRASVDPPATKSLHDLTSFTDDSSLDGYTTPLFVSTTRGQGELSRALLTSPYHLPN